MTNTFSSHFDARPVLAFSHLRWNFVYQRPQHLLTRFQRTRDVHFWEEVVIEPREVPELRISVTEGGLQVITPLLPPGMTDRAIQMTLGVLLDEYIAKHRIAEFIAWYYTPMALQFSSHLTPELTVYDCMDELSAFQGAPPELVSLEQQLFSRADIVFCGGASLYAAKRRQHRNVHLFPSSIDRDHFGPARAPLPDPPDQACIPHPRIGFYGVLDERLDQELLDQVAELRPAYHFVLIGPVAKIKESELPHLPNIHYLNQKTYQELPTYLSNWDVAMLPFARNASTQFISPTKTPEYLAGGKPVVSTPIRDVMKPYGEMNLVKIAASPAEFADAIDSLLAGSDPEWLNRVDEQLAAMSWDRTFEGISMEIQKCARPRKSSVPATKLAPQRSTANV